MSIHNLSHMSYAQVVNFYVEKWQSFPIRKIRRKARKFGVSTVGKTRSRLIREVASAKAIQAHGKRPFGPSFAAPPMMVQAAPTMQPPVMMPAAPPMAVQQPMMMPSAPPMAVAHPMMAHPTAMAPLPMAPVVHPGVHMFNQAMGVPYAVPQATAYSPSAPYPSPAYY
jgi:hypothetical protein